MKKTVFSFIVAFAAISAAGAYAQNQASGQNNKQQSECCQNKGSKKKADRPERFNPFDGVQLTEDQQQRLQSLRQGLGPQMPPKEKLSDEQKKNLTDAQKKQMKEERKAKKTQAKKDYLNGVKEILTPEQYVVFLENVYLYSPDQQKSGAPKHDKGGKGQKGHKGQKGSRGDKGPRGDKAKGADKSTQQ